MVRGRRPGRGPKTPWSWMARRRSRQQSDGSPAKPTGTESARGRRPGHAPHPSSSSCSAVGQRKCGRGDRARSSFPGRFSDASADHRRGRIHRVTSLRGLPRAGRRGPRARRPLDREHRQHPPSAVALPVRLHHRERLSQGGDGGTRRRLRRCDSLGGGRGRQADRGEPGADDRDQRPRHRGRPGRGRQEEEAVRSWGRRWSSGAG